MHSSIIRLTNMDINDKYIPVNCSFHDGLLEKATFKKSVKLVFKADEKVEETIQNALIKDVYTKKGEEFMLLASGMEIRLDKIISIDEEIVPTSNCFSAR